MEEHANEGCSIVYYCASAQDDVHELYHKQSPPKITASSTKGPVERLRNNVYALLDEDQGAFEEVFASSRPRQCLDRLENYGNSLPTVVLIEFQNTTHELEDETNGAYAFLRALASDIEGARYQQPVMPFAIVAVDSPAEEIDAALVTECLQGGAVEILRSPLAHEDVNRLVGHVKETARPPAQLIGVHMTQNLVDSIRDTSKPPTPAVHRPDETLTSERKALIADATRKWHFPAQDFNMDELTYAVMSMLEHILSVPELEGYGLPRANLVTFLLATRRQYKHDREVYYHNWRHAVDVAQSIYCFLLDVRLYPPSDSDERRYTEPNAVERLLTPLDGLILLVSAIGHDVGHPGVNNAFLVACNHPLAQTYNDRSVLENYHCAAYSQLLRRHWPSLNRISSFRATMISTILATDMQRHFEYMSSLRELKAKLESSEPRVEDWSTKDRDHARELIMALLIKAADISNVARPFEISAKWAKTLMNEFARQGELESELQIPTCLFGGPPNKEDIMAAAQSQKGFMSLFGSPLFQGIADIMPSVRASSSVRELENNRNIWDGKIEEEKRRREPHATQERPHFSSVNTSDVKEAQAEAKHNAERHESEPGDGQAEAVHVPSTPTKRAANTGTEPPHSRHAAHDTKYKSVHIAASESNTRSSSPFQGTSSVPSAPTGGLSRRSSKDVALDHMQQISTVANQNSGTGSRRGSADASWQVHQSYPNSRRCSKDESLTTILVTSGGTPARRNSPSSPGKKSSPANPVSKRHSQQNGPKQATARMSAPSARSQTTSTVTANTRQYSPSTQPSTQPSSLASEDEALTPPAPHGSIPSTEDPFMVPGNWPDDLDGAHRSPNPDQMARALASEPPTPPPLGLTNSESTRSTTTREASGDADAASEMRRKDERGIPESRSRSRLRGLKFWKKKKDVPGVDSAAGSPTGSP